VKFIQIPDAPGASPRRWGAPFAIVMYYLFFCSKKTHMNGRSHLHENQE